MKETHSRGKDLSVLRLKVNNPAINGMWPARSRQYLINKPKDGHFTTMPNIHWNEKYLYTPICEILLTVSYILVAHDGHLLKLIHESSDFKIKQ